MPAYKTLNDLQLVHLLKGDDEVAFAEIYARYADNLTGFASAKLYNSEDARDVIHDVFVRLWEQRKEMNVDRNLEAYLFTLIRYRIIDKIRKNITRKDYAGMVLALQISYTSQIEEQISAKELKKHIDLALEKLSPRVKEIYNLSREENLSIPEIADKLQLSEQTVKNQLTFALKHLRKSLASLSASTLLFILPLYYL